MEVILRKLCEVKEFFNMNNSLTIESPGVDKCLGHDKATYFLPHPGKAKNFLSLNPRNIILKPIEASYFITDITKYDSKIFVGETLILVYLLNTIENHPKRYLEVGLNKKSFNNLNPLIQRFFKHPRVNFSFD